MEEALDKLWFKIKNMHGYELEWEWMTGAKNGEYLMREEVLSLIDALKINPGSRRHIYHTEKGI